MDNKQRRAICVLTQQLGAAVASAVIEDPEVLLDSLIEGEIDIDDAYQYDFEHEIKSLIYDVSDSSLDYRWVEAIYHAAFWNEIWRTQASTTPGELHSLLSAVVSVVEPAK